MSSPSLVDALVIGGGPAGLSAALAFARQGQTAIIFDGGKHRNASTNFIHLIPALDHVAPTKFRDTAKADITGRYNGITTETAEIKTARQTELGSFEIADGSGKTWIGRKMILATGVKDVFPDMPGYESCWGKSIFHCLYCKGYEERGSSAGVLAADGLGNVPAALHVARQASALSTVVTIYTNGSETLATDISSSLGTAKQMKVDSRAIKEFALGPDGQGVVICFQDGSESLEPYLAHQPRTKSNSEIADQLGLEKSPNGEVKVSQPFQQTSVRGVFAGGDNCAMLKNVPNAIFTGHVAGQMASTQLLAELNGQKPLFPL